MNMAISNLSERLGVCSWSLQPTGAEDLFKKLAATGISRVQIALDPIRENPAAWDNFLESCAQQGVTCVSGMFGTIGEDYSTLESIRRTGGVVPDEHWEANWRNIQATASLAQRMRLPFVTMHAGFLPHEESDPDFAKLMGRIQQIARVFADKGIELGLETGQEAGGTLRLFLEKLNCRNVGVNFDPANMILYDKGDPVEALRALGPWLRQCHVKDAKRTKVPGTWGEEVVVGTGEVNWQAFFGVLRELDFAGNLCIEREVGDQRVTDIRTAKAYLETLA
jgi:sugar phosphate isomerase/epimerase